MSVSFPKDRKKLLQQWVTSNQNPQAIEADLVLSKTQSKVHQGTRELLTTSEMMRREIPMEKIRAIVAKGQGIRDPDCPEIASLMRFWVNTSVKEVDTDEFKQQSTVRVQADASASLDAMFSSEPNQEAPGLNADSMQAILAGLPKESGRVYIYIYVKESRACCTAKWFVHTFLLGFSTYLLHPSCQRIPDFPTPSPQ